MNRMRALMAAVAAGLWVGVPAWADTTGITGGNQPQSTIQPSLGLNYVINVGGIYNGGVGGIGEVNLFAGNFAPDGTLFCNGQLLPIAQYQALFSLLGTTYGGNGISTFALPDLRGRAVIGTGAGAGLTPRSLGDQAGSEQVTLTSANLPAHDHTLPAPGTVTGIAGSVVPQPYNNMQPSVALNYYIALQGLFQAGPSGTDANLGQIIMSAAATNSAPQGYTLAQGQLMSIAQNTALFSIMGTTYGGNGVNNFALPNLSGRAPVGFGQGNGLSNQVLGESVGVENVTLTEAQLPSHTHSVAGLNGPITSPAGGGQSQTNQQPTLALNYLIAVAGVFPTRDSGGGALVEPTLGEIQLYAGNTAPQGWAFCNGQILSIAQNTALFSILGTTYGGNGQSTFALPDLRGALAVDFGQGLGLSNWLLGEETGLESNHLTVAEMPAHAHPYDVPEPGALGLLGVGVVGLAWRRRVR